MRTDLHHPHAPNALPAAAAFLVGFVGWLAGSALHDPSAWIFVLPLGIGFIGGMLGRGPNPQRILLPSLWLGMLAAYPAALALDLIAYLGENWGIYLVLFLVMAGAGFGAALILRRRLLILPAV
jgi:hypothetical protein